MSQWSVQHWKSFLLRNGETMILRAILTADERILLSEDSMPGMRLSQGAFFRVVKKYKPEKYNKYREYAKRIARMFFFFQGRIPDTVHADVPNLVTRIAPG